jgi:hypothetical protein
MNRNYPIDSEIGPSRDNCERTAGDWQGAGAAAGGALENFNYVVT